MTGADVENATGFIDSAMVLAAGRGVRMGALSQTTPKPLIPVHGRTMLDRAFDSLVAGGVRRAVVNVHHLADMVEAQVRARSDLEVIISDERGALLDTGGGVKRALPHFRGRPFITRNSDCFWIESKLSAVTALNRGWRGEAMAALLLLARRDGAFGHGGPGDFFLQDDGRVLRRGGAAEAPYIYAGAQVITPGLFDDTPEGPFSLNICWDNALKKRSLYGIVLEAEWFHVGDPEALRRAEARLAGTVS